MPQKALSARTRAYETSSSVFEKKTNLPPLASPPSDTSSSSESDPDDDDGGVLNPFDDLDGPRKMIPVGQPSQCRPSCTSAKETSASDQPTVAASVTGTPGSAALQRQSSVVIVLPNQMACDEEGMDDLR